jgi:hypothetical protein
MRTECKEIRRLWIGHLNEALRNAGREPVLDVSRNHTSRTVAVETAPSKWSTFRERMRRQGIDVNQVAREDYRASRLTAAERELVKQRKEAIRLQRAKEQALRASKRREQKRTRYREYYGRHADSERARRRARYWKNVDAERRGARDRYQKNAEKSSRKHHEKVNQPSRTPSIKDIQQQAVKNWLAFRERQKSADPARAKGQEKVRGRGCDNGYEM